MNFKLLPLIAVFVAALGLSACRSSASSSSAVPTVAVAGSTATVKYAGFLYSASAVDHKGTKFDSGQFDFKLGTGGVIAGFDQAANGMKIGDKKTVQIPASLAYGASPPPGSGIPANADLVFDIELVALR